MLGRLIGKIREAELADPPQTLKLGRVDERDDEPPLIRIGIDTNDVMNRIAVYSLGQFLSVCGNPASIRVGLVFIIFQFRDRLLDAVGVLGIGRKLDIFFELGDGLGVEPFGGVNAAQIPVQERNILVTLK